MFECSTMANSTILSFLNSHFTVYSLKGRIFQNIYYIVALSVKGRNISMKGIYNIFGWVRLTLDCKEEFSWTGSGQVGLCLSFDICRSGSVALFSQRNLIILLRGNNSMSLNISVTNYNLFFYNSICIFNDMF